jgi:uncharacterized protein (DUF362 family)
LIKIGRREFILASAHALAAASLAGSDSRPRLGLVRSSHARLGHPSPVEDPLDYARVREMVWKAIEYGRPRAGSLGAKIRPDSWVVIKPNIVFLRPQGGYRSGDVTDFRVTAAVLEYVAQKTRAGRVTIAEGGSYRQVRDPVDKDVVWQDGRRVDALSFDWGPDEFAGWRGSLGGMLTRLGREFPGKSFDYVDLSYDAVRDESGAFRRIEVPRAANGVGAFGARPDYFVTNTITKCDFLINVPVAKIHLDCGITACFKNYVGTAPRQAYAPADAFWNANLHREHSVEGRIDPFIADLAAFHPPDFNVVDGLRGLQYMEHNNHRSGQVLQNNFVMAGEDTVAMDSLVAYAMGFNPWDIDFVHMGAARGLGTMDLEAVDVVGDEPDEVRQRWGKPQRWFGRCNRDWRVTAQPDSPMSGWPRYTAATDTLDFTNWAGQKPAPGAGYAAAVRVRAEGHRKAFLWLGVSGKVLVRLNGEPVMERESQSRYRVGQFRCSVELRPGENLLEFQVQALSDDVRLSALLVGPRNDGDTVEGVRWMA